MKIFNFLKKKRTEKYIATMVATFLKGFLVVGLLMWYSVAILSAINDYFRVEFNTYIQIQKMSKASAPASAPASASHTSKQIATGLEPTTHFNDDANLININNSDNYSHKTTRIDFFRTQQHSKSAAQCVSDEHSSATQLATIDATAIWSERDSGICDSKQHCVQPEDLPQTRQTSNKPVE